MFYYLFEYLQQYNIPGAGVFQYITFRAAMVVLTSLIISLLFGKKIIYFLQRKQIGESIRDLGLEGQLQKKGTPTMGGIIIILSIVIPLLLFADLKNVYILLMIASTIWLGVIGFIDDYIKVVKKDKKGLHGKFKVIGQVGLGIIVGTTLYYNSNVVIREKVLDESGKIKQEWVNNGKCDVLKDVTTDVKSTKTTIPFVKNNEFDYEDLLWFLSPEQQQKWVWLVFIIIAIFIITAVSNGANMTDGLDGLATGTSAIIGVALGLLAYVSGNVILSDYLNIMYIPHSGELMIFASAFIGATVGFLWYNSYPAQVFMGDTGSLALGGIIAVFAIIIRKELLIPLLAAIFLAENLSVMIQVFYFKYTKKRTGEGKRVFLMAPLHHHFQKKGYIEPKIVTRFWIVGIFFAILAIITLKLR